MHRTDILAIAAHPDDIELHVSGTLLKRLDNGGKVALCDLTRGERGTRGSMELRTKETELANSILGLDATSRWNLSIPDGDIRITSENLESVIRVIRHFRPRILLAPSASDRHPDHGNASALVREAWFNAGLSGVASFHDGSQQEPYRPSRMYEFDHAWETPPDLIVDITAQFDRKLQAIAAYSSQFTLPDASADSKSDGPETYISTPDFMHHMIGRMHRYGFMIGCGYGEAFHVVGTPVGVGDLADLI